MALGLFSNAWLVSDHHHAVRHQPAAVPFRSYPPGCFRRPGQRPRFLRRKFSQFFDMMRCYGVTIFREQTAWNPPSGYVSGMDGDRAGLYLSQECYSQTVILVFCVPYFFTSSFSPFFDISYSPQAISTATTARLKWGTILHSTFAMQGVPSDIVEPPHSSRTT